jgi:hypothetical protein
MKSRQLLDIPSDLKSRYHAAVKNALRRLETRKEPSLLMSFYQKIKANV